MAPCLCGYAGDMAPYAVEQDAEGQEEGDDGETDPEKHPALGPLGPE